MQIYATNLFKTKEAAIAGDLFLVINILTGN